MRGVVARGTLFMSKGFSEGSRVYWWRDFSRPGIETDRPESRRGDVSKNLSNVWVDILTGS